MEPLTLQHFLDRHGPLWVPWEEGDWWVLRWICVIMAVGGAYAVVSGAGGGVARLLGEVFVALLGLVGFVILRRISPRHGGVRLDATGLQIEPEGVSVPAADIQALRLVPRRTGGLSLVVKTLSPHRGFYPFRARFAGQEARIRVSPEAIGPGD